MTGFFKRLLTLPAILNIIHPIESIWYLRIQLIVVVEVEENRDEFW